MALRPTGAVSALASLLTLLSACAATSGGAPGTGVPVTGASGSGSSDTATGSILEVNVTNTPDRENGQPRIAINPKNPDNLVFVATNHQFEGGLFSRDVLACFVAYSTDRGETWTGVPWPLADPPGCGEALVAVDASGTFYVANNQLGSAIFSLTRAQVAIARSTDGGRMWSDPVHPPLRISGSPKLRVDARTAKIYAVGGLEFLFPSGLSVSADHGRTWSAPATLPAPDTCMPSPVPLRAPLCGFPGTQIAVHDGILAAATQDARSVTFHVSTDDGRTFADFPVTTGSGEPVKGVGPQTKHPEDPGGGVDPIPWISADPTKSGRFAMMLPRASTLEVYVTEDAGKGWTGPAVIAAPGMNLPWMDFGSSGLLGVMWRTNEVGAYATVSFDHGQSFGPPIKVNRATQPLSDSGPPGDDWSGIALDDMYAFVTWSDGRSGGSTDGILARVPLSLFQRSAKR